MQVEGFVFSGSGFWGLGLSAFFLGVAVKFRRSAEKLADNLPSIYRANFGSRRVYINPGVKEFTTFCFF